MTEQHPTTDTATDTAGQLAAAAADLARRSLTLTFWESVDASLELIRTHRPATFDGVKAALDADRYNYEKRGAHKSFFGGSGGDASLEAALRAAGWSVPWADAGYHYVARSSAGEWLTYVEGDVYRGCTAPGAAAAMLKEAREWLDYHRQGAADAAAEGDQEDAAKQRAHAERRQAQIPELQELVTTSTLDEAAGCDRLAEYYRAHDQTDAAEEYETRAAALRLTAATTTP